MIYAPASAGEIDRDVKTTGGVCLNGGKSEQMAFQPRADLQNQAIGWLRKGCSSLGSGKVVRFPQIWMSSGECRIKDLWYKPTWSDRHRATRALDPQNPTRPGPNLNGSCRFDRWACRETGQPPDARDVEPRGKQSGPADDGETRLGHRCQWGCEHESRSLMAWRAGPNHQSFPSPRSAPVAGPSVLLRDARPKVCAYKIRGGTRRLAWLERQH